MGSERKSKEKSRKRASDSQSEDEGERKRHRRSSDACAEGSRERDKKEKSHHKRDSKEKKSQKKHKSKHSKDDRHSRLDPIIFAWVLELQPRLVMCRVFREWKTKFKELSDDDYFSKNNEFATWLKEEKNKFFSDLSSESARDLFSQFVEVWNSKKLKSKYYKGIETGPRSSHQWKIKT